MAYIESLLGRGEQILYVARQHIFVLVANILTELALIALLVAAGVASNMAFRNNTTPLLGSLTASDLILAICVVISVVVLVSGFVDYLRWNTDQVIVTDSRVIQIRGILNKRVLDSSLEKINDVELRQSLLGRMLNYGTIEILTASGGEGVNMLDRIENPLEFKRIMREAKANYDRGYGYLASDGGYRGGAAPGRAPTSGAPHSPTSADIQQTLEELAALRDRGILSIDEFEAKKRELLSRI